MTVPVPVDHPPPQPLVALMTISHEFIGKRSQLGPELVRAKRAAELVAGTNGGVVFVYATFGREKDCHKAAAKVIPVSVFYVCMDERDARRLHPEAFF